MPLQLGRAWMSQVPKCAASCDRPVSTGACKRGRAGYSIRAATRLCGGQTAEIMALMDGSPRRRSLRNHARGRIGGRAALTGERLAIRSRAGHRAFQCVNASAAGRASTLSLPTNNSHKRRRMTLITPAPSILPFDFRTLPRSASADRMRRSDRPRRRPPVRRR